jgi:hypothetical protein
MSALLNARVKIPRTKHSSHIKPASAEEHYTKSREDDAPISPKSQVEKKDSGRASPHNFNEKDDLQPASIQPYQSKNSFSTSIDEVPITTRRKLYVPNDKENLKDAGTARASIAASRESPSGTTEGNWAAEHQHQTVRLFTPP